MIACTDGGCSESPTTDIITDTTVPEHLDPPSAIPVSESYISVQWKPPKYPNGPGNYIENTSLNVWVYTAPYIADRMTDMVTSKHHGPPPPQVDP